jgi:hypothetical protein
MTYSGGPCWGPQDADLSRYDLYCADRYLFRDGSVPPVEAPPGHGQQRAADAIGRLKTPVWVVRTD